MTLSELRAMTRDLMFDKLLNSLQDPNLDRFLNSALQEVWTVARSLQRTLFVAECSFVLGTGTQPIWPLTLTGTYTRIKQLLFAWRTDGANAGPLGVADFAQAGGIDLQAGPGAGRVALLGESVVSLNPPAGLTGRLWAIVGLPDMTAATNTPGQSGAENTGTANFLPLEYHRLVALKAAAEALKAENGNWAPLQAEYEEGKASMAAALRAAADNAEDR